MNRVFQEHLLAARLRALRGFSLIKAEAEAGGEHHREKDAARDP